MQVTLESQGDKQAVYPLLEANLDKLDDKFTSLLQRWATNTLSNAQADTAQRIAKSIFDFSNLIQQYPHGSKAVNQDMAIAGYEIALSVFTRDTFPEDWARTQGNLAIACVRNQKKSAICLWQQRFAIATSKLQSLQ